MANATGTASYFRNIYLIKLAVSIVTATLAYIVKPFVVLGVLIKILNDPRTMFVKEEDRSIDALDDPRIIKLKRRQ